MNLKNTIVFGLLTLLGALPATADLYYRARTWQEGDQANEQLQVTVEAWVDGERADIRFVESGNPFMAEGSRLVTKDDVRDLYLVDDREKTVQPFQLDALLETMNSVTQAMGGMVKLKVENVSVETLLTEPGPSMLGYPTTHHRYRTSYDITVKVLGMGQTQHVESIQDIWSTTAIDAPAMAVWLQREPPDFGDTGFAELIEAEQSKVQGVPLKTVVEEVSEGKKKGRNERRTVTITEVEAIEDRSAPAGAYTWPADYEMLPGLTAEQMAGGAAANDNDEEPEEEEEKKGWRSRLPFGKKKGGG